MSGPFYGVAGSGQGAANAAAYDVAARMFMPFLSVHFSIRFGAGGLIVNSFTA